MIEFDEALNEAESKMAALLKESGSKNLVFRGPGADREDMGGQGEQPAAHQT